VTREKLIQAAEQHVRRFGPRKATLQEIAETAGVSKAAVLYHFATKEALVAAVIAGEYQRILRLIRRTVARHESAEARLRAFFETRYRHIARRLAFWKVSEGQTALLEAAMPLIHEVQQQYQAEEFRLLRGILEYGADRGEFSVREPDLVTLAILAGLSGVDAAVVRYGGSSRITEGLDLLMPLLLDGLRPRAAPPPPKCVDVGGGERSRAGAPRSPRRARRAR
jgi:AcrR family transcriptional regulator